MGQQQSVPIVRDGVPLRISSGEVPVADEERFKELCQNTSFDQRQIKEIMKQFGSKNYAGEGVDKKEFERIAEKLGLLHISVTDSELSKDVIVDSLFEMFDVDNSGTVDFYEFVSCASILMNGSIEEKAEMLFRVYDNNGDGKVSRKELSETFKKFFESHRRVLQKRAKRMTEFTNDSSFENKAYLITAKPLTEDQINTLVDSAFKEAKAAQGYITQEEFVQWAKTSPKLLRLMKQFGMEYEIEDQDENVPTLPTSVKIGLGVISIAIIVMIAVKLIRQN